MTNVPDMRGMVRRELPGKLVVVWSQLKARLPVTEKVTQTKPEIPLITLNREKV